MLLLRSGSAVVEELAVAVVFKSWVSGARIVTLKLAWAEVVSDGLVHTTGPVPVQAASMALMRILTGNVKVRVATVAVGPLLVTVAE